MLRITVLVVLVLSLAVATEANPISLAGLSGSITLSRPSLSQQFTTTFADGSQLHVLGFGNLFDITAVGNTIDIQFLVDIVFDTTDTRLDFQFFHPVATYPVLSGVPVSAVGFSFGACCPTPEEHILLVFLPPGTPGRDPASGAYLAGDTIHLNLDDNPAAFVPFPEPSTFILLAVALPFSAAWFHFRKCSR